MSEEVWGTRPNSNRIKDTFVKGFLDVSGGSITVQKSSTLRVIGYTDDPVIEFKPDHFSVTTGSTFDISYSTLAALGALGVSFETSSEAIAGKVKFITSADSATDISINLTKIGTDLQKCRLEVYGPIHGHYGMLVDGDISFNYKLYVRGDSSLGGNLFVTKSAQFYSDVSINGNLYVNKDLSLNGKLYVTDNAFFNSNTRFSNPVSIQKDISSAFALDVSGITMLRKNLYVGSDVSFGGKLFVNSDVSLNSKLFVGSDASFNQKLIVGNDVSFNSKLFVRGTSNLVGDVSMNSKLIVGSDVSFNSKLFVSSDVSFNSKLIVGSDVSFNSKLFVRGTSNLMGDVSLNGNLQIVNKVGIGTVPSATYELDVLGQVRIKETVGSVASASGGSLVLEHADASGASSIVFKSVNGSNDYGYIQYQENVGGPSEKGLLTIGIENESGSGNTADRISLFSSGGSGFVGINTQNPLYHLDVSGSMNVSGNITSGNVINNNFIGGNLNLALPIDATSPIFANSTSINSNSVTISNINPSFFNGVYDFSASSFDIGIGRGAPYFAFENSNASWGSAYVGATDSSYNYNQNPYLGTSPYSYQGGTTGSTTTNYFTTTIGADTISGEWLQIKIPTAFSINKYSIRRSVIGNYANTSQFYLPSEFYLAGSNNGTTWSQIDFRNKNDTITSNGSAVEHIFDLSSASLSYTYFRLVFTKSKSQGFLMLCDFKLYGTPLRFITGKTTIGNDLQLYGKLITNKTEITGGVVFKNRVRQDYNDLSFTSLSLNGYYALDHEKAPIVDYDRAKSAVSNWTSQYSPGRDLYNIVWSPGLKIFCSVGGPNSYISSNGITWTSSIIDALNSYSSVVWSPKLGLFCASGYITSTGATGKIAYSYDGISWTNATYNTPIIERIRSIAWSPDVNMFVAVTYNNTTTAISYSFDGINWTSYGGTPNFTRVIWVSSIKLFIAITTAGTIKLINTGSNTTIDSIVNTYYRLTDINGSTATELVYSHELGIILAYGPDVMFTSFDGYTWKMNDDIPFTGTISCTWSAELGIFCVIDTNKSVYTSNDGFNWTGPITTISQAFTPTSMCWSPDLSIFCCAPGSSTQSFLTSSLIDRIPTAYNVFNISNGLNGIDQSGNWTFNNNQTIRGNLILQRDASLNGNLAVLYDISVNRNLFVSGRTILNGDVSMNSKLIVGSDVSFNSKLFVGSDVSFNSKLIVGSDVSFNSKLFVNSTSNLIGDVSMNSKLIVGSDVSFNGKLFVGADVSMNSKLIVGNDVSFNSKLFVNATSNLVGDVSMNSKLIVGSDVSFNSKLFVNSTSNLVGDVSMNSKLIVGSDVSFNSKLFVNATSNLVGDVSMNSKLIVGSDVSFNGKLFVGSDVSFNSKLIVGSDVSFNSKLFVNSTSNLVGDVSMNSKLIVGSDVSFNGKLFVGADVSMNSKLIVGNDVSFNSKLFVNATSNLVGDVSMNSKLIVGSDVSFNSKLFVRSDVSFNSKLIVGSDVSFNGKLFVNSDVSINGMVSTGNLFVNGVQIISGGGGTVSLTGNVQVGSNNGFVSIDKPYFYADPSLALYYNFDTSYNNGTKIYNLGYLGSAYDGSLNVILGTTTGMINTVVYNNGIQNNTSLASFANDPNSDNFGLRIGTSGTVPVSTSMTFSFWIYKRTRPSFGAGDFDRVFHFTNSTSTSSNENHTIALDISSGGNIFPVITNIATSLITPSLPIISYDLCTSAWNHIVWTINGTNSNIYINGSLRQNDTLTQPIPGTTRANGVIAYSYTTTSGATRDFSGNIDDFRYYNGKALNYAEIYQLYNNNFYTLDICGGFLANGSSVIYETVGSKASANTGSLTLLHGDASGSSSIMFKSVNDPLEYGYIQYEENAVGSTGYHFGLMTLGIENDAGNGSNGDRISLFPSGGTGYVGVNTKTPYASLDVSGQMRIYEGAGTAASATGGSIVLEHGLAGGTSSIVFKASNSSSTADYAYIQYTDSSYGTYNSYKTPTYKWDLSSNVPSFLSIPSRGTNTITYLVADPVDASLSWVTNTFFNGTQYSAYFNQGNMGPFSINRTSLLAAPVSTLSNLTFSCWINPTNFTITNNYICIASFGTPSTYSIELSVDGNGQNLILFFDTSATIYRSGYNKLKENIWYHVAFTYSPNPGVVNLYLNGILQNVNASNAIPASMPAFTNLYLGSRQGQTTGSLNPKGFQGFMSYVNVFDTALNAADIFELYQNPQYIPTANKGLMTIGIENDINYTNSDSIALWPGAGTGCVGINTKYPRSTLDVNGSATISSATINSATIGSLFVQDAEITFINGITVGKGGTNVDSNTALGFKALDYNTTGYINTAVGYQSLVNNTSGYMNTAVGYQSLVYNTTGGHNSALGYQALFSHLSGNFNSAVGYEALYFISSEEHNVAIGYRAGSSFDVSANKGNNNTFLGSQSRMNGAFSNSTAVGFNATITASNQIKLGTDSETVYVGTNLTLKTTGVHTYIINQNTTAGAGLFLGTNGNAFVSIGTAGMYLGTASGLTGSGIVTATSFTANSDSFINGLRVGRGVGNIDSNTAIGNSVLGTLGVNTGSENTAVGNGALYSNTSGSFNVAVGSTAIGYNNTQNYNTAIGYYAGAGGGDNNSKGNNNTFLGANTYVSGGAFSNSTAVGSDAVITASNQVMLGNSCTANAQSFTSTYDSLINGIRVGKGLGGISTNTAVGASALNDNTDGNDNTALGYQALKANTSGYDNTAIGVNSLVKNETGRENISVGMNSLSSNVSGIQNVAVGNGALYTNTGSYNTAIGYQALNSNQLETYNTAVGYNAGYSNRGNFNTFLGGNTTLSTSTFTNSTAIGFGAQITASNQIKLGTDSQYVTIGTKLLAQTNGDNCFIRNTNTVVGSALYLGVNTTDYLTVYSGGIIVGGVTTSTSFNANSDYRLKENIMPLNGTFTVDVLNPVIYNFKDSSKQDIGFIAHEVQEFYPFLVTGEKDGSFNQSLNYNGFIGILTKEIKDLKVKVARQEAKALEQEDKISAQEDKISAQDTRIQILEKMMSELINK